MAQELIDVLITTFWMILGIAVIFAIFLGVSGLVYFIWNYLNSKKDQMRGYASLKTVTFGDESSVTANRVASVSGVITVFLIWMVATGSSLLPFKVLPVPFVGDTQFEYTATNAAGETDNATVKVRVTKFGDTTAEKLVEPETSEGFAKDDVVMVQERRAKLLRAQRNDEGGKEKEYKVTAVNGQPIQPNQTVEIANGTVLMTNAGSLQVRPYTGPTMEALYLPPPEQVWSRFLELNAEGYQGVGLWENVMWSLIRVVLGFFLGCLFGIPLGFAMGLNSWLRGWFDPIVEFMRPVPPLALIPLVIIWFGIGEQGKVSLLFLAALWIMIIGARAGVSGVNISKVHAAYSLGATKTQLLLKVILPNSLPEIFTAARVAMGVCWGTVVAAELVAAEKGAGKMIIAASKFQLTDIVIIGIIIIGIIGFGIDVLMRMAENKLVPWKGRG
ncbi:MAG: ABC transporter permease subunit [Rhizobiaceae bacterium]|nr:ABC transporter permease [Hyphomicrobiales bacterium]NRB31831.1 ABC transporter permease subunit [Rhizobiaceae bacterium]